MPEVPRWFATSPFPLSVESGSDPLEDPDAFLVHAKQLGTTASACGLNTAAWVKHWVAFEKVGPGRACLACREVVAGAEGAGGPPPAGGSGTVHN